MKRNVLPMLLMLCLAASAVPSLSFSPTATNVQEKSVPPGTEKKLQENPDGVTPGKLIKRVAPKYPKEARKRRIHGQVILKGTITKDGHLIDLKIVSGDPVFVEAAIAAVKRWKYKPYLLYGTPVEVDTTISVNFDPAVD